jgi:hypothetical protein
MASSNKTLYEVLGVARNAKATDIGRAYNLIKADLQKETSAPNPRLAAMAKVAYETLYDPDRRAEYDATLASAAVAGRGRKGRGATAMVASIVAVIAVAGAGYYFFGRPAHHGERDAEKALSPQEILQAVAPQIAHLQGALVSGEVRDLGVAVAVGENEMVTTCRGMAAGMLLTVKSGDRTSKAELARANEDLDICTLTVKGAGPGVKIRTGMPGTSEQIQAVLVNAEGQPEARQVSVARAIKDAKAAAFELRAAVPLPNGTPAFDSQARLVGIVVTPHAFGEGLVVALGTARIAQARGGAASREAVADPLEGPGREQQSTDALPHDVR